MPQNTKKRFSPLKALLGLFIILLCFCWLGIRSVKSNRSGIQITANKEAEVEIDGIRVGNTPYYDETRQPGTVEVKVTEKVGGQTWKDQANLVSGTLVTVHRDFADIEASSSGYMLSFEKIEASSGARIKFVSDPGEAIVLLDGKPQGLTPLEIEVDVGPHVFSFTHTTSEDKKIEAVAIEGYLLNMKVMMGATKSVVPVPQDPKKPKLTEGFIQKISVQASKPIDDLVAGGGIISYSENETGSESGQIGRFKFSIAPREPTEANMALYPTTLNIFDGNKLITTKKYEYLSPIGSVQVKTKNQLTKIFKLFTFGAHCCVSLAPVTIVADKVYIGTLLNVMNTDMIYKDQFFIRDDNLYKIVYDDRFSYYNMSFRGSEPSWYPMIYLIDEKGFSPAQDQFKDFYEKLYQSTIKEMEQIETRFINWEDPSIAEYLYAKKIYMYAVGYLAGHDRAEIKEKLIAPWPNLVFKEGEIYKIISDTRSRLEK